MTTTPPPPSGIRTPPAPRYGPRYDQYEPYVTRHSARLAGQTPSEDSRLTPSTYSEHQSEAETKGTRKQRVRDFTSISPEPFDSSPQKKKGPSRNSAFPQMRSLSNTSDPFTTTTSHLHQSLPPSLSTTMTDGMLPTPAKTPKKKAVDDAGSTARTLFPATSGTERRKRGKKPTGFSLESFEDNLKQDQNNIEIYTDSRDRIPELDESEDNPFYTKPGGSKTIGKTAGCSSGGHKEKESKRDKEVGKSLHREDGMFYVFRGKKFFRKFDDEEEDEADDNDLGLFASRPDLLDASAMSDTRRLTRSSIKPRVLFPGPNDDNKEDIPTETDEEAATDIEDNGVSKDTIEADDMQVQDPVTPPVDSTVATPATPGATIRTLRSHAKRGGPESGTTPSASTTRKTKVSPFAGWQRKKQSPLSGAVLPKKRETATESSGEPATKRTRGNRATVPS
ncbi:hypothetical protein PHISCL_04108 [Aspergillus sclerotialis]|uniref:Uncharacterized protein n=1 Tax=Aspergillus sclerotialis TaxID=2070753 RepID=A0A3A3A091_9EURO|nr:hypothetical protein PHISCL_04108 [Aspergillus sclerotialis]